MARRFRITPSEMWVEKDGVKVFDASLPPVRLYPAAKRILVTGQTISFPDFHHANAYAFAAGDIGGGVIHQSCSSFVSIPFQDWGPVGQPGISDVLADTVIGTVPGETDFLHVRIKATRTAAPDQVNGNSVPVAFQEGEWVGCDGGTLLVEYLFPVVRMVWIRLAPLLNPDGTRNVLLSRKQSILKRNYTFWRSGNSSSSSGWTYGGTNGRYGHIVKLIQSKGPSFAVNGVLTFRRGDGQQCSLVDTSSYASAYTADIEITPGFSGINPSQVGGGGGGSTEVVFTDGNSVNVNSSTHTYAGLSFGLEADVAVAQTRHVIVAITAYRGAASGTASLNGVTIGGVAATLLHELKQYVDTTGSNDDVLVVSYYGVRLDAGETGSVVLSYSASFWWSAVDVYAVYDLPSLTPLTAQSQMNTSGSPVTKAFVTQPYGVALATGFQTNANTQSWTGFPTAPTFEDYPISSPNSRQFARRRSFMTTPGTSLSVDVTANGGGTQTPMWAGISLPGTKPKSYTYNDTVSQGASATTTTYTGVSFGDEPAAGDTRHVLLGINVRVSGTSRTITSVTIGGVPATLVSTGQTSGTSTSIGAMYVAEVPTGTSGNVVISTNAGSWSASLVTSWSMYNLSSPTPVDAKFLGVQNSSVALATVPKAFIFGFGVGGSAAALTGFANAFQETFDYAGVAGIVAIGFDQVYGTSIDVGNVSAANCQFASFF